MPSAISVFAPISMPRPIFAPFRITLLMPISVPSPMVQPCSITLWPMLTRGASVIGKPGSTCSTEASWMLQSSPITMRSFSARITTWNQTLTLLCSVMSPTSVASCAT